MKLENRFTVPVPVEEAWQVLLDVERIAPCMPGATLTNVEGDSFEGTVKVKVGPINLTYGGKARFVSKDDATHVAVIDGSGKETRGTGTAKALITCRLIDQGDTTDVEVDTDLNVTGKPAQFGRGVLADVSGKLVDQFAACLSDEIRSGSVAQTASDAQTASAAQSTSDAQAPAGVSADGGPDSGGAAPSTVGSGAPAASGAATAAGAGAASASAVGPSAVGSAARAAGADSAAGTASTSGPGATTGARSGAAPRQSAEAIDLLGTAGAPVLKRVGPALGVLVVLVLLVRRLRR